MTLLETEVAGHTVAEYVVAGFGIALVIGGLAWTFRKGYEAIIGDKKPSIATV